MNEHLGGAYQQGDGNTWMPDVWGYLVVRHQVTSMLDLGCGFGHAMKWFSELLVNVTGVEGWDEAVKGHLLPARVVHHDYTKGPAPFGSDASFDLGWAAEFVEHVDEEYIPNFMRDFLRCRQVCITHAEPGQNGHHHVTLKDDDFWIDKFASFGFVHSPLETALLRQTDRWKAGWGRRTLMLFRNNMIAPLPPVEYRKPEPIYHT